MRYLGGKSKLARDITSILRDLRSSNQVYLEPFMGSAAIFYRMDEPKIGTDAHPDLMLMWQALQNGWIPPETITEEEYLALKHSHPSPLRGFAGFACAFGGDWFHGYAKDSRGDDYVGQTRRSVLKRIEGMRDSLLFCLDYVDLEITSGALIYCDPPYHGTSGYDKRLLFDRRQFWDLMRLWSRDNTVLVSEFQAPIDFICVWEKQRTTCLRYSDGSRQRPTEKLFTRGGV